MTSALGDTVKGFVTSPGNTFRKIPVNSEFLRPLLYAIILGWIGSWAEYIWSLLTSGVTEGLMGGGGGEADMGGMAVMGAMGIWFAIFAPLMTTVIMFVGSGITHLVLMLVASDNRGYWGTFKVLCYAGGTASLASLIPLCGSYAGGIWDIVLAIIGLAAVHRISQGKAALAVLLPVVLFCACIGVAAAIFGTAMMAALGGGN